MAVGLRALLILVSLVCEGQLVTTFVIPTPGVHSTRQSSGFKQCISGPPCLANALSLKDSVWARFAAAGPRHRSQPSGLTSLSCKTEAGNGPIAKDAPEVTAKKPGKIHLATEAEAEEATTASSVLFKLSSLGSAPPKASLLRKPTPRMQKLRDIIFKKEAFEALTSAEFALTLDTSVFSATSQNDESGQIRSLATIDYEGILRRLGASSRGLDQGAGSIVMTEGEIKQLRKRLDDLQEKLVQRLVMFSRAQPRKADGEATEEGANGEPKSLADRITEFGQSVQQSVARIDVVQWFKDAAAKTFEKEGEKLEPLLQAFVREDGSLDLDSVNVPPREEVVKMGGELWARLNGVPPGEEAPGRNMTALKEILKEDQAMAMLEEEVRAAQRKVMEEQRKRGAVYDALRALRGDKTAAGQSTWWGSEGEAGGKGAGEKKEVGRDGVSSIIQELREAEERCFDADQILGLWELERDMERICKYLVWELEQTDEVQEQQKLVVAEFGLLDAQVRGLRSIAMEDEEDEERLLQLSIGTEEDAGDREARRGMMQEGVGFVGMRVDPDELSIVVRDVMDLERRLGIDELLEETLPLVPKFSPAEIAKKIVDGGRFYLEGSKLLGTDVQYALKLVLKAALGVTLQPREVRTLRRTLKDVVTFVPFAIILIIPLSPVGHVLVFSFIQRFFPDFFPSPYTDRRQNLVRIYQSVELSLQNQRSTATPGRQRSSRTLERW